MTTRTLTTYNAHTMLNSTQRADIDAARQRLLRVRAEAESDIADLEQHGDESDSLALLVAMSKYDAADAALNVLSRVK
jgi:hypothetical protein